VTIATRLIGGNVTQSVSLRWTAGDREVSYRSGAPQ